MKFENAKKRQDPEQALALLGVLEPNFPLGEVLAVLGVLANPLAFSSSLGALSLRAAEFLDHCFRHFHRGPSR